MDQPAQGTETSTAEPTCKCRHSEERFQRQSSSRSSAKQFARVTNPPNLISDSLEDMESDLVTENGHSPVSLKTRLQVAQQQIAQLLREKQDAFRQVKEITKMNTRWQKYDKEREDVVVDITSRLHRTQERLRENKEKTQQLEAKIAELRIQNEELELRWTDARVRAAERKSELERVQRELQALQLNLKQSEKKRQETNRRLEAALKQGAAAKKGDEEDERSGKKEAEKDRDLYHMSKRVVDLKEKVDHLEKKLETHKKEMEEQADLYTQQISICLDDFKQEKKDKEQTKKENCGLKKQLKKAEDFASSLKVQINRYQEQQKTQPPRIQPSIHHVHKYYGNVYGEHMDSWDDAGYALPSDVVRDHTLGFDDIDNGSLVASGHRAPVEPPPQYDDRSVMGHIIASPPRTARERQIANAGTLRVDDLVLH